jgi:hypothetical protein
MREFTANIKTDGVLGITLGPQVKHAPRIIIAKRPGVKGKFMGPLSWQDFPHTKKQPESMLRDVGDFNF